MCVLSFYRPGVMPNRECLENGADSNPHGHGYAIIAGSDVLTGHSMSADAAIEAFIRVRAEHRDSYALFHSRITTDGATTLDNCHPFIVGDDPRTVLAHNGILPKSARPGKTDARSDTRILAEELIPRGVFGHLGQRRARRRLAQWTLSEGYGNKLVILTTDPRYGRNAYVINEHLGEWSDGVWWSNSSYRPYRYTYSTWSPRKTSHSRTLYTAERADTHIEMWDDLYTYGVIGQSEWLSGITDVYAKVDTWIPWSDLPIPPLKLRMEMWNLRTKEGSPLSVGPVGSETLSEDDETGIATRGKCRLCGDPQGQNLVTGFCTACDTCNDCESRIAQCLCYVSAGLASRESH